MIAFTFRAGAGPVAIMLNATGISTTTSNPLEGYIQKSITLAANHAGIKKDKLIWIDHGENTKKTLEAIETYNQSPAAIAIGMGNSFQALLAGQMMASNKLLISPVATADEILNSRASVALLGNTSRTQARTLARELKHRARPNARILIARLSGCVYCVSMADHLKQELSAEFLNVKVADLAQLGAMGGSRGPAYAGFDHIFVPTLEAEAARIIALLWPNNQDATFWGTDGWGSLARYVRELPFSKRLNVLWISHYHPSVPTKANRRFVTAYRAAYRTEPTDTSALYYEAAMLTFKYLGRSHDPATVFSRVGRYSGITGTVRIKGRHVSRPMPLLTLRTGEPKLVKMVTLR